eukprot:scaffold6449_cov37-Prasinocladus_malaysianus.AAC.1
MVVLPSSGSCATKLRYELWKHQRHQNNYSAESLKTDSGNHLPAFHLFAILALILNGDVR